MPDDAWRGDVEHGERCWCGCDVFRVILKREGSETNMYLRCERCDARRRVTTPGHSCHEYGVAPEFAPKTAPAQVPAAPAERSS